MFGFTSKASIHWIVPVIGAALYLPGVFCNFQSILMYITMAYPKYSASVLASNDLFRSGMASVFPYVDPVVFLVFAVADITALQAVWPRLLQESWPRPWLCSVGRYLVLADACILRKL
jgi:DHA1 family multidrug resistance protein-like MFS transporter